MTSRISSTAREVTQVKNNKSVRLKAYTCTCRYWSVIYKPIMLKIIVQTLLNIDNKDKCNIRPNSHLTIQFPLVLTFYHLATGVSMLFLTVQYGKPFYYLLCKKISYIWATSWENLLMLYANNKGADQPVNARSLISAFVVRCLDSIIYLISRL